MKAVQDGIDVCQGKGLKYVNLCAYKPAEGPDLFF